MVGWFGRESARAFGICHLVNMLRTRGVGIEAIDNVVRDMAVRARSGVDHARRIMVTRVLIFVNSLLFGEAKNLLRELRLRGKSDESLLIASLSSLFGVRRQNKVYEDWLFLTVAKINFKLIKNASQSLKNLKADRSDSLSARSAGRAERDDNARTCALIKLMTQKLKMNLSGQAEDQAKGVYEMRETNYSLSHIADEAVPDCLLRLYQYFHFSIDELAGALAP